MRIGIQLGEMPLIARGLCIVGYAPTALSKLERTFAMEEIWKDVVGYEGLYQVSNLGNVKSLNWGKTGKSKNLWLKPHTKGYLQVELAKNGIKHFYLVHRLVAEAFIQNPFNFPVINHIDEDKTNNSVSNLEWCTKSYNTRYSMDLHPTRKHKELRFNLPILQLTLNGEIVKTWECSRTIFLETGMSDWSISECCRGNRKTAYGYKWQYAN